MHEAYVIHEVLGIKNGWDGKTDMKTFLLWLRNGYNDGDMTFNGIAVPTM